jgi:uncharacterized protein
MLSNTMSATSPSAWANHDRLRDVRMVLLKATHRCNLSCAYCHDVQYDDADMPITIVESAVRRICMSSKQRCLTFVFHGGEPSILGAGWLSDAFEIIKRQAIGNGKVVALGFQTNGVGIGDDLLEVLRTYNVGVCISIDGPPYLQAAPRPYSEIAASTIMRANEKGLCINALATINQANWFCFNAVFRWLEQLLLKKVKVNVLWKTGRATQYATPSADQIFQAQRDIIDYMLLNRGSGLIEENITRELIALHMADKYERTGICGRWPCGAGKDIISVEPNGELLPCGRFVADDMDQDFGLSNPHEACEECEASRICSFGCRAFLKRSSFNPECRPTQSRMAYYLSRGADIRLLTEQLEARIRERIRNGALFGFSECGNWTDYSDYSDYR